MAAKVLDKGIHPAYVAGVAVMALVLGIALETHFGAGRRAKEGATDRLKKFEGRIRKKVTGVKRDLSRKRLTALEKQRADLEMALAKERKLARYDEEDEEE